MQNRFLLFFLFFFGVLCAEEDLDLQRGPVYTVKFEDVPIGEFIRFVSKISNVNFLFNRDDLNFNVTFSSPTALPVDSIVKALIRLLQVHHFYAVRENGYLVVHKANEAGFSNENNRLSFDPSNLLVSSDEAFLGRGNPKKDNGTFFSVYKLQYHEGAEIVDSLKKMGGDFGLQGGTSSQIAQSIASLQWVKMTNSLIFSGDDRVIKEMNQIISALDAPLRQVFIEVLVIETDVQKGLEFGLQWAASGKYDNRVGGGFGNFAPHIGNGSFAHTIQGIDGVHSPQGLNQIPLAPGFDLGVIGDIITHKGRSFLSLGSLVSALQADSDSTIVLNQKIITQDNKHSKIFVGDNIPFTGSVVTTVGQSQQTTANIEYRDVGVSLNITPMLGDGDVITLSLDEEITEAVYDHQHPVNSNTNGIRTTKTNMLTHVHVPDKHFLVLSGMIRNAKASHKTGIPCLGGIPWIGALFSRTKRQEEKRNVIIFVRPQIIHSFEEYGRITRMQEKIYEKQANSTDFIEGLNLVPPMH